jgi:hypothetical protein
MFALPNIDISEPIETSEDAYNQVIQYQIMPLLREY